MACLRRGTLERGQRPRGWHPSLVRTEDIVRLQVPILQHNVEIEEGLLTERAHPLMRTPSLPTRAPGRP